MVMKNELNRETKLPFSYLDQAETVPYFLSLRIRNAVFLFKRLIRPRLHELLVVIVLFYRSTNVASS